MIGRFKFTLVAEAETPDRKKLREAFLEMRSILEEAVDKMEERGYMVIPSTKTSFTEEDPQSVTSKVKKT